MATKNNPGKFDCYANAEPDEPMFVLLGRDPAAPGAIMRWATDRIASGKNKSGDDQIVEALGCAAAMAEYRRQRDVQKEEGGPTTGYLSFSLTGSGGILDEPHKTPRRSFDGSKLHRQPFHKAVLAEEYLPPAMALIPGYELELEVIRWNKNPDIVLGYRVFAKAP